MSDAYALLLVGALGVLTAFVERRDGWRFVALAERLDRDMADLRERVTLLEHAPDHAAAEPAPRSRWPWGSR